MNAAVNQPRWLLLTALLCAALAVLMCLRYEDAAHSDGQYVPVGIDSFYHARRVLDAVRAPDQFYEYDRHIHVPEGSQLVWPWGYDRLLSWIVRAGLSLGISDDPMAILVHIPAAASAVGALLVVAIAAMLGLPLWAVAASGLGFALLPLTQFIYGVGCIDHHYTEQLSMLAALLAGLAWLARPERLARAVLLGIVLGIAPAFHNALFILQLPWLAAVFLLWLRSDQLPRRAAVGFALALLLATLLILLPSEPFRAGRFEFYLLSWYHLYVATGTALITVALAWLPRNLRSGLVLAVGGIVLLIPLALQISLASSFIARDIALLGGIEEAQSVLHFALQPRGLWVVARYYSSLVIVAPLTIVICGWLLWRPRNRLDVLFAVTGIWGLTLLLLQFRLHYYGSVALGLPWLIVVSRAVESRGAEGRRTVALVLTLYALAYLPPIVGQLFLPHPVAGDSAYEYMRAIFPPLKQACDARPGTVLAVSNDGHFIRYHSECSVIANNFILTGQQEQKIGESKRLLALSPAEFLAAGSGVRYVLAHAEPALVRYVDGRIGEASAEFVRSTNPRLVSDLLLTDPAALPPRLKLLSQLRGSEDARLAYVRLFEVLPANEPANE